MKKKTIKEFNFKGAKRVGNKFKDAKVRITVTSRMDPAVIEWLKNEAMTMGIGYQTFMNHLLKMCMNKNIKPNAPAAMIQFNDIHERISALENKLKLKVG